MLKLNKLPIVYNLFPIITTLLILRGVNVFDTDNPFLLCSTIFSCIISGIILYNFVRNNVLKTNTIK